MFKVVTFSEMAEAIEILFFLLNGKMGFVILFVYIFFYRIL